MYKLCDIGAHLGFIATIILVAVAFILVFVWVSTNISHKTGSMGLGILGGFVAISLIHIIVYLIEKKTNWF